jgi:N-acetylglucosamine-6-sulfatase
MSPLELEIMNVRRWAYAAFVSCLGIALIAPTIAGAADRPNVVVVLVDDLRWDALGATGHPFARTPHIDRIAREGVVFENAFVTIPLCSPSRGSFLTGRHAHSHGVKDNRDNAARSHELVTFPMLLRDAGYATAFIGKWHMGNDDSPRPGFDRWVSFKGQGEYIDPQLNFDGVAKKTPGYITDLLNDEAVAFIGKQSREKPFLLYLSHKAVHGPFTPAERDRDRYQDDPITLRPSVSDDLTGKPMVQKAVAMRGNTTKQAPAPAKKAVAKKKAATKKGASPAGGNDLIRNQLRAMSSVDDGVGLIYEALAKADVLDNTLIVFTSDNGYNWGEHRLGDKRVAYEESIRIPMLARLPGRMQPGSRITPMVLAIDLAPTVLDLAGVKIPDGTHGLSMVPLFEGKADGWRTAILTEYFREVGFDHIPTWQSVRTDRWKYIHYPDTPADDELYDLQADPYEMKNRIDDPAAKEQRSALEAELRRQLESTP